jgi:CO/xanthine dehydrogenase Mo-binding subunit
MYAVANRRVLAHNLPGIGFLKASFLRSPLDIAAAFASEQTIDDLALAAKMDPYLFRKQNITDERWLGVLDAAAKAANWTARIAASRKQNGDSVTGRGIGLGTHFTSYGAAVAEVRVNRKTGQIVATHMTGAIDCGLCINPALVENQISGMMMQAASRMLHEEVAFDENAVTSLDWNSYPVLRFDEHPEVTAVVVQRIDQPSTGAGEEVLAAGAAAIANAVFDAIGVRLRQFPLTPQRVRAALSA